MTIFSVIIPVFNGESYISETVESVIQFSRNQSREVIVINDGSKDSTLEILQKYAPMISIINQTNAGEASAVNKGISLARGRYSLVVSADDPLISENLFVRAQEILDNDQDCVAVYPDWQMIDAKNEVLSIKYCPEYSFEELLGEFHCIPGPGTIFRTQDALAIGGRSSKYKFVSDYDFWLRLALRGKFSHVSQILAQWRSHDQSTSIGHRGEAMALERIGVIRDFLDQYPQSKDLAKQAKACSLYNAAILSFFNPELPGRRWMIEALRTNKRWIKSSKIHIVGYLLLLPISRSIYNLLASSGVLRQHGHR